MNGRIKGFAITSISAVLFFGYAVNVNAASVNGLKYSILNDEVTVEECEDKEIEEIVVPDFAEGYSVTAVGANAFCGCYNLSYAVLPETIAEIGQSAFQQCETLKRINLPSELETIGNNAFYACRALTAVDIPDGVIKMGESVFSRCVGLTGVNIPNSVMFVGECTFEDCTALTNVKLSNKMTTVEYGMFANCAALKEVTFSKSITTVGDNAFYGCGGLETIYFYGSEEEWDGISFGKENTAAERAEIKYMAVVTYTGDYVGTDFVIRGEDAVLPESSDGYNYVFTVNGNEWDGKNISDDVTVEVRKQCERCVEIEKIALSAENNAIEFEYRLKTSDKSNLCGTFYFAAYNANGRLLQVYKEEITADGFEKTVSEAVTTNETPTCLRAFFWGGTTGMEPLGRETDRG